MMRIMLFLLVIGIMIMTEVNYYSCTLSLDDDDNSYVKSAFTLSNGKNCSDSHVNVELGGVMVEMMTDSGASANIVDEELWRYMKRKGIKCISTAEVDKTLYRYSSK